MKFQISCIVLEFNQVEIQVKYFILQVKSIDPLDLQLIYFDLQFMNQVDCIFQLESSSDVATFNIYLSRIQFALEVLLI